MITLSADFIARATAKDTRKITIAHLYYDDTNFLPVASVATVIDGVQYYGILKDMGSASQKWNITGANNVTINTPKINLIDYTTPNGFSIITEFNTHTYYGRKMIMYYGYDGQTLSNMLKVFDGIIDEINYNKNEIEVTGKSFVIPPVDIQGREIRYDIQKIGTTSPPTGFTIFKENDKKVLPVPFGNHWCAPMQPAYTHEETKLTNYCLYDESYSSLISKQLYVRTDIYQYNIGAQGAGILLLNDDAYTPLHLQGWSGDNEYTYYTYYNSATYQNGINIVGIDSGNHRKTDDKFFVTVPLRYQVRTDLTNWFTAVGYTSYDTDTTISKVFDNTDSTPWTITNDSSSWLRLWVKLTLDEQKNLRGDEQSFIRSGRKISIPSTTSNNNGQGYLVGKYNINIGTMGWFHDDVWIDVDYFPITISHWKNGYIPDTAFTGGDDGRYIGAGDAGRITPTTTRTYPYTASYGARVFNKYTVNNYNYSYLAVDDYLAGLQGSNGGLNYTGALNADGLHDWGLKESYGNDPMILRQTLAEPVGAALCVDCEAPKNYNSTGFGDNTLKLYKLCHLTAGEIDLDKDARAYAAAYGITLTTDASLNSTNNGTGTNYRLRRPYQYLEFLLKDKTTLASFSSDFSYSNINTKWNNFFSTSRDYSGFVIDAPMTLDKFVGDYIKEEPFTVYVAEDGSYQFKMLNKTYVTGDTQGTLDYNDATDFSITLTPSKNIINEIKAFKTDYMYDLDDYVLNINWRIVSGTYSYGFWKYGNTVDNNEFKLETIEKKYTSYNSVDIVTYGGKHWGCVRTNTNQTPADGSLYWKELNNAIATNAWSSSTKYFGEDAEQYEMASWYLNQWCNRHRVIEFETDNLKYLQYNVGDIVEFSNVPFTLAGIAIKGFDGNTNFTSTINGQTIYASFVITSIQKSLKKVVIEAMQLHKLDNYSIERVN